MQQHGIIDLNLRSSLPTVSYITERLPDSHIYLKPSIYKERRDIAIQKAEAMIQFCQKNECRTQQVIAYFGQTSEPCGTCDVCQKNSLPLASIPRKILELLERPLSLKDLSIEINLSEKETEDYLREFLKNEIIIWMEGKFYLN
jgi:ATP-dependent DNA helicase RecQ